MPGPSSISSSSFSTVVPAQLDEAPPTPPPAPATTADLVAQVKVQAGARDAERLNAVIAHQRKAETPSARELGICKTVVSTSVQAGAGLGTLALTQNPIAAIGATAASKLVGDAAAAIVCEGQ